MYEDMAVLCHLNLDCVDPNLNLFFGRAPVRSGTRICEMRMVCLKHNFNSEFRGTSSKSQLSFGVMTSLVDGVSFNIRQANSRLEMICLWPWLTNLMRLSIIYSCRETGCRAGADPHISNFANIPELAASHRVFQFSKWQLTTQSTPPCTKLSILRTLQTSSRAKLSLSPVQDEGSVKESQLRSLELEPHWLFLTSR